MLNVSVDLVISIACGMVFMVFAVISMDHTGVAQADMIGRRKVFIIIVKSRALVGSQAYVLLFEFLIQTFQVSYILDRFA